MIGGIVKDSKLGEGKILEVLQWPASRKMGIVVEIAGGKRNYVFPDAFSTNLTTEDPVVLEQIKAWHDSQTAYYAAMTPKEPPKAEKTAHAKKQTCGESIAFKCNFCDGGCSENHIGFRSVCSEEMITYNVKKAKHIWYASEDSPCRKYLDGEMTRQELDDLYAQGPDQFICYECGMLNNWKASGGIIQTGVNKGKPMRLERVQPNSLAVLTSRKPDATDHERFIFAVFLVADSYTGDEVNSAYVEANPDWKLELTPEEAMQMPFWKYYICQNAPDVIKFGSGLHRYLSDVQAAQILKDIAKIKADPAQKQHAEEMLAYFCRITGQSPEDIPAPSGALCRN